MSVDVAGRVPPYNADAEQAILGGILLKNDTLVRVMQIIDENDFYVEANKRIYRAMLDVARSSLPIDAVTIGNKLKSDGDIEKIGGAIRLSELTDLIATTSNIEYHAGIVRDHSIARGLIYAATEIAVKGFSGVNDIDSYIEESNLAIMRASQRRVVGDGPQHIDDALQEAFKELESGEDRKGLIRTGVDIIDRVLGGLQPRFLTILAGRPSMGKSLLIINIAANVALSGKKVLYITLEDDRKFTVYRLLSRFADIDLTHITLNRLRPDEWPRIIEATNKLSGKKPLWIDDTSAMTPLAIRQTVISHKMVHGVDLVIVDHLGEIPEEGETETVKVTNAARAMRNIAKDLNIPLLLACQLNRSVENTPDKRPELRHLKQSGEIEALARTVLMLYREGYYNPDGDNMHELELIVAKQNQGKPGLIKLWVDLPHMYVRSWDVTRDGVFGGTKDDGEARVETQKRKRAPVDDRQGSFFRDYHDGEEDD